jgi:hypothetical protein
MTDKPAPSCRGLDSDEEPDIQKICEDVAMGKSLVRACEGTRFTVWSFLRRLAADDRLQIIYDSAKQSSGASHASVIIDKANWLMEHGKDLTKEEIQAHRVALEKLQWVAARMFPRDWAESKTKVHELGGSFMEALEKIESSDRPRKAKLINGRSSHPEHRSVEYTEVES